MEERRGRGQSRNMNKGLMNMDNVVGAGEGAQGRGEQQGKR